MQTELFREEFSSELQNHILPFWMSMRDEKKWGFYGAVDGNLSIDRNEVKGCVRNSKILWTFATAYKVFQDKKYLSYATHAYVYLRDILKDISYGGVYWSVTSTGRSDNTSKHAYSFSFAILALSVYYEVTGDSKVLGFAKELFLILETKFRDGNGYRETFSQSFQPLDSNPLSRNGVNAQRTLDTLLCIFEAYTELYRVSGFEMVKGRLNAILTLFEQKLFNREKRRLNVYFDNQMNSILNIYSYGRDMEASWVLDHGLTVMKERQKHPETEGIIDTLAKEVLRSAFDGESISAEKVKGKVINNRISWVQCEAVIGFTNAYERNPGKKEFIIAARSIWSYIKNYLIDSRAGGEWFFERLYDKTIREELPEVSRWKSPYHNSRLCFEMMERLSRLK